MKVKDLKKFLEDKNDELEILLGYSDDEGGYYVRLSLDMIEIENIDMSDNWEGLEITREEYEEDYHTVYEGHHLVINAR